MRVVTFGLCVLLGGSAVAAQKDRPKLPELTKSLESVSRDEREAALAGLGELGPRAAKAVAAIVALVQRTGETHRSTVVDTFARIGMPAIVPLVAMLEASDWQERDTAADALARIGREALPALMSRLRDGKSWHARWRAAELLGRLGQDGKAGVAALIQALQDPNRQVRYRVVESLRQLAAFSSDAVPGLLAALDKGDARMGHNALIALGLIKRLDDEVLSAVRKAMKHADALMRVHATEALARLSETAFYDDDRSPVQLIPDLVARLKDREHDVRAHALMALGWLHQHGRPAYASIIRALDDPAKRVRWHAAEAISRVGRDIEEGNKAFAKLERVLKSDPSCEVRAKAAETFGWFGQAALPKTPALVRALKQRDAGVRGEALNALARLAEPKESTVREIARVLAKDDDGAVREKAAQCLGSLGKESKLAVRTLVSALGDQDAMLRATAASALGELGNAATSARSALELCLKDVDAGVRRRAREALEKIPRS